MRRRLATIFTTALLSSMLLLPVTAAPALAESTAVVLAAESGGEVTGPEGRSADDPDNEFAPESYEANWTWRAGKVLLAVFVAIGLYLGLMYWLRVSRPARSGRS